MAHHESEKNKHGEEEREHVPSHSQHIDPDYLKHHDAARILKNLREQQMRPLKFPT